MPVSFNFERNEHGNVGCTIGIGPGMFVGGFGDSLMGALHAAAHVGSKFSEAIQNDPALAALMPPGTVLALKAISAASAAAKQGHSIQDVAQMHGPKVAAAVQQIIAAHADGTP